MHPKDDFLRAFADKELSITQTRQVQEHLLHCPDCQKKLNELAGKAARVRAHMDVLAPRPVEQPASAHAAYTRFTNNSRSKNYQKENFHTMNTRRPLWTALAIIAVLAIVFTVTPASAWAANFLSLFRVEKVQVISFNPAAVDNAKGLMESNQDAIKQVFQDDLKITKQGDSVKVASVSEATDKAGFTPRLPSALKDAQIAVQPGMKAVFNIDQPKLQSLIDAAGVDIQLPESVNGKDVTVDVPSSVVTTSGCPAEEIQKRIPENCTALIQMHSPVVDTPEGLDVPKMGEAVFRFLGIPTAEARALSQKIDWTTTLILPVPQGGDIEYQDVKVDGVSGTLLKETGSDRYSLVWVKDGILYGLSGQGSAEDALKIAGSIQ